MTAAAEGAWWRLTWGLTRWDSLGRSDPSVKTVLQDPEFITKLRKWSKGEVQADELNSDPRMQQVATVLEAIARQRRPPANKA